MMLPARDLLHMPFRAALEKSGWTVTHDPWLVQWENADLYVDLAAERPHPRSGQLEQAAFEIKGLDGRSFIEDLRNALGQYLLYQSVAERTSPERQLWMAITENAFYDLFEEGIGALIRERFDLRIVMFDPDQQEIIQWLT